MSYRLLALDLDGTLLRRDGVVDDRDIAAIAELQAAGVIVTIVTGRLHSGSTAAPRACAIDGVIGCCDGSHLVEAAPCCTTLHVHPPHAIMANAERREPSHRADGEQPAGMPARMRVAIHARMRRPPARDDTRADRQICNWWVEEPATKQCVGHRDRSLPCADSGSLRSWLSEVEQAWR